MFKAVAMWTAALMISAPSAFARAPVAGKPARARNLEVQQRDRQIHSDTDRGNDICHESKSECQAIRDRKQVKARLDELREQRAIEIQNAPGW